ncbi:MAG TPA: leucyl aminopeptidase [Egibacteraceae bacterium]|nr:leucyl aminopeptidase [Egibacteraceae bacterium]
MLTITAEAGEPLDVQADMLVVGVFKGGIEGPGAGAALHALGLGAAPVTPDFRGDVDQTLLLSAPGLSVSALLLVGLGRMDAMDPEALRRAAAVAARAARKARRIATTLAEVHVSGSTLQAVAEGFRLGAYEDRRFRSQPQEDAAKLEEVVVLVPSSRLAEARAAFARAEVTSRATCAARDLVNLPPDRKRPEQLAAAVEELARGACEVSVRDEAQLADEGFGGVLAVGRGSSSPPRVVQLHYIPEAAIGRVTLVGKGITFDTGGLNLKNPKQMADMKSDMAGAAAIAAACSVLPELDVRMEVTALLALAENMPGADAQRPDDVIRIRGGATVEVRDTDAEGRLVLADLLAYAAEQRPDAIVDLATLTGSAVTAVGQYAAAIMGSDDELIDALRLAAAAAGEPLWPLPLWPDLERFLDTPIADVNNTGDGAGGGAIIGGLFLKRFVGDVPWAHMDIAGPSFLSSELSRHYLPPGGTGFGVRTLLAWLQRHGG